MEKDVACKQAFVNDEIVCEIFSENSDGDKAEKAKDKLDLEQNCTFPCGECGELFTKMN